MGNTCKNCNKPKLKMQFNLSPRIFGGSYRIYVCETCGVGTTFPPPLLADNHYEESTRPEIINEKLILSYKSEILKLSKNFELIMGRKPSSILDIGCGNGLLIWVAQQMNFNVMGIEPSKGMCDVAKSRGVNAINCYLEDYNDFDKYDIIIFHSVIEHLPDPHQTLKTLFTNVTSDNLIVFQQAVYDGLIPKLFRRIWYGWAPAEHYWHYTQQSFSAFVETHNFKVHKVSRNSLYYQFIWLKKIKNWKSFVLSNTLKIFSIVADLLNQGDSIYVFCKKNNSI